MSAVLKTLEEIRAAFPALQGAGGKSRLYADHAATSLKPKSVSIQMKKYLEHETANAGRGYYFLAEKISANVEKIRKQTAVFVGAKESSEIIFTRGATDALNLLALSLGERFRSGDEVVVTDLEHHSNFVPWKLLEDRKSIKLRSVSLQKDGSLDLASLKKNLNPKTRLLAVTTLSNVTGEATPLEEIISLAHQKKIPVMVDAAQAVVHSPLGLSKMDADYAVFSGHKMFGPTGIGVLYGKKPLLEKMPVVIGGGGSVEKAGMEGLHFREVPHRFEPGTLPLAEILGLGAAIEWMESVGFPRIQKMEADLVKTMVGFLEKVPGLRLVGKRHKRAPIFSFSMAGIHPHDLAAFLDSEGIAIRAGQHCAGPLHRSLGLGATSRISLAFFNSEGECRRIQKALLKAAAFFRS